MYNKAVIHSSFYYSINMLRILVDLNYISDAEAQNTIESLAGYYGITDVFYL